MKAKLLTMLTLVIAISGAFITNAYNKTQTLAMVPGYIDYPDKCMTAIQCSDIIGPVCRDAGGNQAFGKFNADDTTCPKEVYRLEP